MDATGFDGWGGLSINGEAGMQVHPVTCVCGSTRFYREMLRIAVELTAQGEIVLMSFNAVGRETVLDDVHRARIRLADRIVVVTDGSGYVGRSTRAEMAYAREIGNAVSIENVHY